MILNPVKSSLKALQEEEEEAEWEEEEEVVGRGEEDEK